MTSTRTWVVAVAFLAACTPMEPRTETRIIGPAGVSIALDEATLVVPPGAVASDTTFSITATDDAPPAGYEGYSRIFRF